MVLTATYTRRFFMGQIAGSTTLALFTVPAGNEYVITDITVSAHGSPNLAVKFAVGGNAAQPWVFANAGIGHVQWSGRQVLLAGEQFFGQTTSSVVADVAITGFVFPA